MRRRGFVVVLMAALTWAVVDLGACGDKFLRPGRSSRMKNYAAMHPASILLYSSPNVKPEVLAAWQKMLKHAGHKPFVVRATEDLSRAVAGDKYDIVIADYGDAGKVRIAMQSAPSKPGVLPVLNKPDKALANEAKKEFQYLIDPAVMDKHQALVEIDHLMEVLLKATTAARQ
jgi:hypothetical protein